MLQIILLLGGALLLIKRNITVSSQKELSGIPAVLLGVFYLLTGIALSLIETLSSNMIVLLGVILLVTVVATSFFSSPKKVTTPPETIKNLDKTSKFILITAAIMVLLVGGYVWSLFAFPR